MNLEAIVLGVLGPGPYNDGKAYKTLENLVITINLNEINTSS